MVCHMLTANGNTSFDGSANVMASIDDNYQVQIREDLSQKLLDGKMA